MELKLKKQEHTVFIDMASDYPSMDVNPPYDRIYGMPMGVVLSMLKKRYIEYDMQTNFANILGEVREVEKIITCPIGVFHFVRGGKHRGWLCYKHS